MNWISDKQVSRLLEVAREPDFSGTRYRVLSEIARGGMGTVYRAEDTELDRQIAIKVLTAIEANEDLTRRMIREAKIIARLEHPGIVPVHDVGLLPDGRVFYAMKLIRGSRLDEYIKENISLKDMLRKFHAVCEAVAFAHVHGVIHRDLKPQNIMIGSFGEVLVLDWGVAKLLSSEPDEPSEADTLLLPAPDDDELQSTEAETTAAGTIIGTPHYMSPEQARGDIRSLDQRSDVFSLGAILYFLLTNQSPRKRRDQLKLARPRELNTNVTKAAEAVCLKAMSEAPADRYTNARELAADISHLVNDEPAAAYRENALERTARFISKNRFLILLVAAYLLMRIFFIFTSFR